MFTSGEAAEIIGVSKETIKEWSKKGRLESIRDKDHANRRLFREADVYRAREGYLEWQKRNGYIYFEDEEYNYD